MHSWKEKCIHSLFKSHLIDKGNFFNKKQSKCFIQNFFFLHKCINCIVWNWFIEKNFTSQKYLFCSFSNFQNGGKSEYFKLEQRSVIKLMVAEKCVKFRKECVICMEKHVLVGKNNVYKWAIHGFSTTSL